MVWWKMGVLVPAVVMAGACGSVRLSPSSACGSEEAKVVRVLDGDTIELEDGSTVRYLHVDTPELAQNEDDEDECFAGYAKQLNEELVLGRVVRLEYDLNCTDAYARTLAFVSVDNRMVNKTLIERGYGKLLIMPPNLSREAEFVALEKQARENAAGIWGACQ